MSYKIMSWRPAVKRNNQAEVVDFLIKHPFKTEKQICFELWGDKRQKKHADLLVRARKSGKITRTRVKTLQGNRFHYYVASEKQGYEYNF
jgi:hypothetical protein